MFDGNHRTKRTVNLGGGSKRRRAAGAASATTTNRAALLQQTRQQRLERQEHENRKKAARLLQRKYRTSRVQRGLARQLQAELVAENSQLSLSEYTTRLNLLLRLPYRLSDDEKPPTNGESGGKTNRLARRSQEQLEKQQEWLNAFAQRINSSAESAAAPLAHSIVQAVLRLLSMRQLSASACRTIWSYCLGSSNTDLGWRRKQLGGMAGFEQLLQTTQTLLHSQWATTASMTDDDDQDAVLQDLLQCVMEQSPRTNSGKALVGALLLTLPRLEEQLEKADSLLSQCCARWESGTTTPAPRIAYREWLLPLVSVMNTSLSTDSTDQDALLLVTTTRKLLVDREITLLANALLLSSKKVAGLNQHDDDDDDSMIMYLVQQTLDKRSDLALLSSLVAKGDDIRSLIGMTGDDDDDDDVVMQDAAGVGGGAFDDDGSESSDDEDEQMHVTAPKDASVPRSALSTTFRLTKQDLQTLPKLDRLHQQQVTSWEKTVISSLQQQWKNTAKREQIEVLVQVAYRIGGSSGGGSNLRAKPSNNQWLAWASAFTHQPSALQQEQAWITSVFTLLESCTGLRARQSAASPLLTQLAFYQPFVEGLWRYCQTQDARLQQQLEGARYRMQNSEQPVSPDVVSYYRALSVFCDVFSHWLIALKDDQFLALYTTFSSSTATTTTPIPSGATKGVILARDVIIMLRTVLYQLYWTNPVRASDIQVAHPGGVSRDKNHMLYKAVLGRVLITGTKLWNTLYERWCRLVRHASSTSEAAEEHLICDEATWLFPNLTTLTSDHAVVGMERNPIHRQQNQDAMDVDEDDADSSDYDNDDEGNNPRAATDTVEAENDDLANSFSDPKMARILTCIPQALPFSRRVKLFHSLLTSDKLKAQHDEATNLAASMAMGDGRWLDFASNQGRQRVEIHRDRLYDDSMQQLNQLGPRLKQRVQVSFINQHGAAEAGIDGGGVFKEFIDDLIKDAFSIDDSSTTSHIRLFSVTPQETLAVNPGLTAVYRDDDEAFLSHYEFLGRVLGKAVYESILVEPQFCLPFLNQLLGKSNHLEDLKNYDLEYYRNLIKLLSLSADEIDSLGLSFELTVGGNEQALQGTEAGRGGATRTVALVPGGRTKPVTKQNVIQYVHLVAHYRLNVTSANQTKAFLRGFRDLVPAAWVRLFSAPELQKLIGGDDSIRGIDVDLLQQTMNYAAGYHPSQPIIQWFWEIVRELTAVQQRQFLKFMTSCSRQPLLGFASLDPLPCIQQIRLPDALFAHSPSEVEKQAPLPSSSTCMNLLKLPNYRSKELLRRKLLTAIESGAGFELT